MGLGSTAKTVQRLSDLAEKLYKQVNEVLERVSALQERVESASDDIAAVRREQREQRAILAALAEEQGVDVEAVLAEADLEPETGPAGSDEEIEDGQAPEATGAGEE